MLRSRGGPDAGAGQLHGAEADAGYRFPGEEGRATWRLGCLRAYCHIFSCP